jgi:hypothetical protein
VEATYLKLFFDRKISQFYRAGSIDPTPQNFKHEAKVTGHSPIPEFQGYVRTYISIIKQDNLFRLNSYKQVIYKIIDGGTFHGRERRNKYNLKDG